MMTPAQIAAKLTPAQARALRNLNEFPFIARLAVAITPEGIWLHSNGMTFGKGVTPLGLAVLAELDKGVTA